MGRLRDMITAGIILTVSVGLIWLLMIRPHTFDWQDNGHASGTIKTLMSNSKIMGAAEIKAVVVLESGKQRIIAVPLESNVRAGTAIIMSVQADSANAKRKRYTFKSIQR